ncbi:hypothetical protein NIES4075_00800 [Tolypothrix sp. NIES-4075]|nr:hypothetical protein NIES4075_00800 [Tolypothrix sp. NIES-4075]
MMSNKKSSDFEGDTLSPILVILVAGSISLAIVNKNNQPAYFDIVKIAIAYSFGSMKSQRKIAESNDQGDFENLENSNNSEDLR